MGSEHKEWCAISEVGCCTCSSHKRDHIMSTLSELRAENARLTEVGKNER